METQSHQISSCLLGKRLQFPPKTPGQQDCGRVDSDGPRRSWFKSIGRGNLQIFSNSVSQSPVKKNNSWPPNQFRPKWECSRWNTVEHFKSSICFDYDFGISMAQLASGNCWNFPSKFYDWSTLSPASELVTNFWNLEVSTIHKPKPPLPGTESSALWYKLLFRSYPGVIQCTAACFGFRATLSLGPVAGRLVPTGVERWVECCRGGFGKCHGESWMLMEWRWMNNSQNTLWKDLVYKS